MLNSSIYPLFKYQEVPIKSPNFEQYAETLLSADTLESNLRAIQNTVDDLSSISEVIDNKKIRIYPVSQKESSDKNFQPTLATFYANGLLQLQGALSLIELEFAGKPELNILVNQLKKDAIAYTHFFKQLQKNMRDNPASLDDFKRAANLVSGLVTQCTQTIVNARTPTSNLNDSYKKALDDMNKAQELYLSIHPLVDGIVTLDHRNSTAQVSERIKFENSLSLEDAIKQKWYQENLEKHGNWFAHFIQKNWDQYKLVGAVSEKRDLPNPENVWQDRLIKFKRDFKERMEASEKHITRMGITLPFSIKDKEARVNMAADNMRKVLFHSPYGIDAAAQRYMDKWGVFYNSGEIIEIPVLHQTLVAPTLFYPGDRNMLSVKTASNQQITKELAEPRPLTIEHAGANHAKNNNFKFNLLQTNNCVNIWNFITIGANRDVNDSNALIQATATLLEKCSNKFKEHASEDSTTPNLFQSENADQLSDDSYESDSENTSYSVDVSEEGENTLNNIISYLKGESNDIPSFEQIENFYNDTLRYAPGDTKELFLLIQAAINLKQLNEESIISNLKRRVSNLIRIKEFQVLSPLVHLIFMPLTFFNYIINTSRRFYHHFKDTNHGPLAAVFFPAFFGYKNKQTFKSAYEEILADGLGMVVGGCKSAMDRAGEVRIHKNALVERFNNSEQNRLLSYTMSDSDYYQYLDNDVKYSEETGHQYRIPAAKDKIGARKMWETRNHYYVGLSAIDKGLQHLGAKFRKFKKILKGKERDETLKQYQEFVSDATDKKEQSSAAVMPSLTSSSQSARTEQQSRLDTLPSLVFFWTCSNSLWTG